MIESVLRERANDICAVIAACQSTQTIEDLNEIIRGPLRELIPHDAAGYGVGDVASSAVRGYFNVDYPPGIFAEWFAKSPTIYSPVFTLWKRTLTPQFGLLRDLQKAPEFRAARYRRWTNILEDYNVRNTAGHGLVDVAGKGTSYFSFAQLERPMSARERTLFATLVPHLHVALLNILRSARAAAPPDEVRAALDPSSASGQAPPALSDREAEILKWAFVGKTNAEIGMILDISEFTVKNHIRKILHKLGARNRTHATAKAINLRLIDL